MNDERCIGCGEASVIDCICDCGRTIWVCKFCLAEDKVLACGQCGIEEASDRANDSSIYWARLTIKQELGNERLEKEKRRLEEEYERLKREKTRLEKEPEEIDGEGEEWKERIDPDED